jgi:hypothetical protein
MEAYSARSAIQQKLLLCSHIVQGHLPLPGQLLFAPARKQGSKL